MLSKTGANPAENSGDCLNDKKRSECKCDYNATQGEHDRRVSSLPNEHEHNEVKQHYACTG
jgi:hypothetical protein